MQKVTMPLTTAPLVHCITNTISVETVANALLYVGAKPIMTEDVRAFSDLAKQTNSILLNLGSLSLAKEKSLLSASKLAYHDKPFVLDVVGVASASTAMHIAHAIMNYEPTIVRGNISEMRAIAGLKTNGRGVDGNLIDQTPAAFTELITALKTLPTTSIYVATGAKDIIVAQNNVWVLENGVLELDRFTGSGDVLGALLAALLGEQKVPETAAVLAISYLNIAGEQAKMIAPTTGIADFRQQFLNQLSILGEKTPNWMEQIKGTINGKRIIFSDSTLR